MTEVIARVHSVHVVNVEQRQAAADPPTKPPISVVVTAVCLFLLYYYYFLTWAMSPPVLDSYRLQPPSPLPPPLIRGGIKQ